MDGNTLPEGPAVGRHGNGLPSIVFAYLGMCKLETCDRDWDAAAKPLHSTGVPLAPLLS